MEENKSILDSASRDASAFASPNPNQAVKKKRNPPGNPDPNAEVIALSPNTLLATNRFVCEICSKGFQRDQNLQLHRRGHNLPWKLKQRSSKEVRKKVYICPEVGCVHHDPSRALGDLTGIKKHFSRKHGEKKWKCDKCQKKYAVHSDWKAHSKTCGTREYRCDCGTPFSRRDSFITHRAFCDVLAEESTRVNFILGSASSSHGITQTQFPFPSTSAHNEAFGDLQTRQELNLSPETLTHLNLLPSLFPPPSLLSPQAFPSSPHMSATALLQKAAEMASKTSGGDDSLAGFSPGNQNPNSMGFGGEGGDRRGAPAPSFGDGTTRDFLGLRVLARGDFLSMAGFAPCMSSSSSYEQLPQSKKPWTG